MDQLKFIEIVELLTAGRWLKLTEKVNYEIKRELVRKLVRTIAELDSWLTTNCWLDEEIIDAIFNLQEVVLRKDILFLWNR